MIQLRQGNYGHKIYINIRNPKNEPIKLLDATVVIDMVFPDKTKKQYNLTILDPENGKVLLTTTAEMLAQVGKVVGYIDVINPASQITLYEPLNILVVPDDGAAV